MMKYPVAAYIFLLFICLATFGCGTTGNTGKSHDTVAYSGGELPADQWWLFYQQGISFVQTRSPEKALESFDKALVQRDTDAWRARIDPSRCLDYFPHREAGILYLERRDYDKAIAELEKSIADAPSARATFYLNRARAANISRHGTDRNPPELFLTGSTARQATRALTWPVTGVASDDTSVTAIEVDGRQVPLDPLSTKKIFSTTVPLAEGDNTIRVTATDLTGKTTEKTLKVYSDRWGPQIEVEALETAGGMMSIVGSVSDDEAVTSLRINGERWPVTGNAPGYNYKVTFPESDILIVAGDRAGNVTRALVRQTGPIQGLTDPDPEISPPVVPGTLFDSMQLPKDEDELSTDDGLTALPPTQTAPEIRLDDVGPNQETYAETILLPGSVRDDSLLIYITLNGQEILNRRGREVYFSLREKLEEGKNVLRFVAADEQGHTAEKLFTVYRRIPDFRKIDSRLSMTILPFVGEQKFFQDSKLFSGDLRDAFVEQARFKIIPRDKTEAILLKVQPAFQQLADPVSAAEVGKSLGTRTVLTGTVRKYNDSLEIAAHLVDAESARIMASNDLYIPEFDDDQPLGLAKELAERFLQDFPLLTGRVLEVTGDNVIIGLGTDDGLRAHTRLICYRELPPMRHPVTGQLIDSEPEIVGLLEAEEIFKEKARAVVLNQNTRLIATDRVIVQ